MNAPLAQLVLSRITQAARHSARLRHALRQSRLMRRGTRAHGTYGFPAAKRLCLKREWEHLPADRLLPSPYTIGPRGVLP